MKSIRDIYKIGKGPSSSHTMGPEKACRFFRAEHPEADRFAAVLYGSLAKTGKGHGTDDVIAHVLAPLPVASLSDIALTRAPLRIVIPPLADTPSDRYSDAPLLTTPPAMSMSQKCIWLL